MLKPYSFKIFLAFLKSKNSECQLFVFPLTGFLETAVTVLTICHLNKGRLTALTTWACHDSEAVRLLQQTAHLLQCDPRVTHPPLPTGATQCSGVLHSQSWGTQPLVWVGVLASVELDGCWVKGLLTIYPSNVIALRVQVLASQKGALVLEGLDFSQQEKHWTGYCF